MHKLCSKTLNYEIMRFGSWGLPFKSLVASQISNAPRDMLSTLLPGRHLRQSAIQHYNREKGAVHLEPYRKEVQTRAFRKTTGLKAMQATSTTRPLSPPLSPSPVAGFASESAAASSCSSCAMRVLRADLRSLWRSMDPDGRRVLPFRVDRRRSHVLRRTAALMLTFLCARA